LNQQTHNLGLETSLITMSNIANCAKNLFV
jgi:hypothetical protein